MMARLCCALVILVLAANTLMAEEADDDVKVGGVITICMTGDLAKTFALSAGVPQKIVDQSGFSMRGLATVERQLDDGRIQIEHSLQVKDKEQTRLLILTGTVAPADIKAGVIQKGAPIHANPGGPKIGETTTVSKKHELELSNFKGLKLRVWVLAKEVDGERHAPDAEAKASTSASAEPVHSVR